MSEPPHRDSAGPTPRHASRIWPGRTPLVAMVHLPALPGAPGWRGSMQAVLDFAASEAEMLAAAGFDGLLVENFGDAPYFPESVPAETVASLAVVVHTVVRATVLPTGVNVLRNDAAAALGIATAAGARFVRVNVHTGVMVSDQGWLVGRAHETIRLRDRIAPDVAVLADVFVKHAAPMPGEELTTAARDTWDRGLADGLVLTGSATGRPVDHSRLDAVRRSVPDAPIWIGSGADTDTLADLMPRCQGVIVGSALRQSGRAGAPLDPERVRRFAESAARSSGRGSG